MTLVRDFHPSYKNERFLLFVCFAFFAVQCCIDFSFTLWKT